MCPQATNLPALIFYYWKRTLETNCPNTTEDFPTISTEYFTTNPLSPSVNVSDALHRSYISDNLPADQINFAVSTDLSIHQHIYLKRWMQIARRNKRSSYKCQECNRKMQKYAHAPLRCFQLKANAGCEASLNFPIDNAATLSPLPVELSTASAQNHHVTNVSWVCYERDFYISDIMMQHFWT